MLVHLIHPLVHQVDGYDDQCRAGEIHSLGVSSASFTAWPIAQDTILLRIVMVKWRVVSVCFPKAPVFEHILVTSDMRLQRVGSTLVKDVLCE